MDEAALFLCINAALDYLARMAAALEKIAEEPKDNDKGPRIEGFGGHS